MGAELKDRRDRLNRTEQRGQGLVGLLALNRMSPIRSC
jgi:hypothetical protein